MTGDLSVTALYTSEAWAFGDIANAELLRTEEAGAVFGITNKALRVGRLFRRDAPSLPHSLVQRHQMIDHLLREWRGGQGLELAAGLSPRGIGVSYDHDRRHVEVDLRPMIARKRELLARSIEGQEVALRSNLHLIPGDIEKVNFDRLPLEADQPVFVIVEGLCMYLEAARQRALWAKIAALIAGRPGSALVFDLVPFSEQPPAGLIGKALGGLMKMFTGGQTFAEDNRRREDVVSDLAAAGFGDVQLFEPGEVGADWGLSFLDVPTQQLIFRCAISDEGHRS